MSKILVQTTIAENPDDWDISRFSLLADELRSAGHQVTARNRASGTEDDPILCRLDELDYDQLWLLAVDIGDGLTGAESQTIVRFRENGGGVLTARDHQDLGSCLIGLGSLGEVNHFHERNPDPARMRDDQDTPTISWPNYHSGANGDYQPVFAEEPVHELLRTAATDSGRIEWFPAHPHEGAVSACVPRSWWSPLAAAPHPVGASVSPLRWTANAQRAAPRSVARWQLRRFITSPTTTGISTAAPPPSSPNRRAQRSRRTRRAW
jgi:hypothetical protein